MSSELCHPRSGSVAACLVKTFSPDHDISHRNLEMVVVGRCIGVAVMRQFAKFRPCSCRESHAERHQGSSVRDGLEAMSGAGSGLGYPAPSDDHERQFG